RRPPLPGEVCPTALYAPGCLVAAIRHSLGDIALFVSHDAFLLRGDFHLLHDAGGRDVCVRTIVPVDVESGQALHGRPHVIADHRDGIIELHHLTHALDRHGLAVVDVDE